MRRLILIRHGEAQARAPSGRDIDRALTVAGQAAAAHTAAALAAEGFCPDVALVSDAMRARQTWQAARAALDVSIVEFKRELYHASAEATLMVAGSRPEASVAVVGHNPGLQYLTLSLLRREGAEAAVIARVEAEFPPGAAAVFDFDAQARPRLEALLSA